MTLYEQLNQTMLDKDVEKYMSLLHEDFTVVFHKSGNSFTKQEWAEMVTGMMANEKFIQDRLAVYMKMTRLSLSIVLCPIPITQERPSCWLLCSKTGKSLRWRPARLLLTNFLTLY